MKQTLLQLHLYGGLLCAIPLLVYGISSLHFNHQFGFMEPTLTEKKWDRKITMVLPQSEDNQENARAIRDSLDLFGWTPWWHHRKTDSTFNFRVTHFGKEYKINTYTHTGKVEVTEVNKGFWETFTKLHYLNEKVPEGPFLVNTWQYYAQLSIYFILFSVISGIYLWSKKKSERIIGSILLGLFSGGSILLLLYVWLIG